jgi:hypothetical protein
VGDNILATRHISISLSVAHLIVYRDMGIEWVDTDRQRVLSVRGVLGVEVRLHAPLASERDGGE